MSAAITFLVLMLSPLSLGLAQANDSAANYREVLAREFQGDYRFHYLFRESGILYVDVSDHLQLLEVDRRNGAPRVSFFNLTSGGEKHGHYSYVFHAEGNKVLLREFDGKSNFRFDCIGTYLQERRTFECAAPGAPKPARDTDSPITRRTGLFKRPTSWPAYETLDRNNIFRFYDWGFVHVQENAKLDADGKVIARETGVITALRITSPNSATPRAAR